MHDWLKRVLGARQAQPEESDDAAGNNGRGLAFLERGLAEQAETCFRTAMSRDGTLAEVHSNLSAALNLRGRFDAAEQSSRTALQLNARLAGAYVNLGNAMLYRGRYGEAKSQYRRALTLSPELPEANIHLALLGQPTSHLAASIQHFEERLRQLPDSFVALTRLGLAYQAIGNLDAACHQFELARALRPDLAGPWASLATLYGSQGCPEQSLALFETALAINENPIWRSAYLFFLQYSDCRSVEEVYRQHLAWGERQAAFAGNAPRFDNAPVADRKLRIAYMSGDFFLHPVANFLEPILRSHDRTAFTVHCYANVSEPDAVTAKLKSLVDSWLDVAAMSDEEVCRMIRADGIDILVDLSGHTRGHRMGVLARKAAPVQATYLGYPGTTGLAAVDFRISDAICDPPGNSDRLHAEKLLRLDGCFVTYLPPADAPEVSAPPSATQTHITFGSFNSINKVNRQTIGLWSQVLQAVPGSRMVIKHFAASYGVARRRIFDTFAKYGIDEQRLTLLPAHPDIAGHLDLYREVDIALDCTPYNGTTTTCEALWMGVPVVTLSGDRHSSRVGASLLSCVGLSELIATSAEDYVARAALFAADRQYLYRLRQTLRRKLEMSPLLEAAGFTARIESAYRAAWRHWCEAASLPDH